MGQIFDYMIIIKGVSHKSNLQGVGWIPDCINIEAKLIKWVEE